MKSFASSEIPLNPSGSKFQSHFRTLSNVSWSSAPANGDRPLSLNNTKRMNRISSELILIQKFKKFYLFFIEAYSKNRF